MEGFPVAVLEAAAVGLPCITTPATSMNSYLKKYQAGFPIAHLSTAHITEAMHKAAVVFKEPVWFKMKDNARSMIQQVFDWKDIAAQLVRTYQTAL